MDRLGSAERTASEQRPRESVNFLMFAQRVSKELCGRRRRMADGVSTTRRSMFRRPICRRKVTGRRVRQLWRGYLSLHFFGATPFNTSNILASQLSMHLSTALRPSGTPARAIVDAPALPTWLRTVMSGLQTHMRRTRGVKRSICGNIQAYSILSFHTSFFFLVYRS